MSASPPLIETQALTKAYDLLVVLRRLDLGVQRGEFVALLGPNGSGKSTLLRLLAGLTRPSGGTIRIGGWEIPREAAAVRAQIGMVSHKVLLYENLTALENLRFFARLYHLAPADAEARARARLEQVGLARRADSLVRTFSRGMQQRLSIARALLHDPHVLLLDEPYTGLDQQGSVVLDELLGAAHGSGRHTLVMATHELDRAERLCDRVVLLVRGQIVYDGPPPAEPLSILYARLTGAAAPS